MLFVKIWVFVIWGRGKVLGLCVLMNLILRVCCDGSDGGVV